MATLLKKLKVKSLYTSQLQQFLLFYRCEKFEFQIDPLGPGALKVLFLKQLLSKQDQWGWRCIVFLFLKKSS